MNNVLMVTFDSLRWDVFQEAHVPFLRSLGTWKQARTQGTFTLPAHMAFFMGKLPQAVDGGDFYDSTATRVRADGGMHRNREFWHLANTEMSRAKRQGRTMLQGDSIIQGYRRRGYLTLGTGAVSWFNPNLPAGRHLSSHFSRFRFFDEPERSHREAADRQAGWIADQLRRTRFGLRKKPVFAFVNFGETHHPFTFEGCAWQGSPNPYGDAGACRNRQRQCLEYLDSRVAALVDLLKPCDLVLCSDHGEAMGEDGLWGHGFCHAAVMDVPLLIRAAEEER